VAGGEQRLLAGCRQDKISYGETIQRIEEAAAAARQEGSAPARSVLSEIRFAQGTSGCNVQDYGEPCSDHLLGKKASVEVRDRQGWY
jgi:hypothetical protein